MMKVNIQKILLIIIFFSIVLIGNNVFAATVELTLSDKDKIVNVGDTVTVTVKVNAAQWDVSVNASGLTYVSGNQRFSELDNAEKNLSESTDVKYKANNAGEFNIVLSGDITDISGDNSEVSETIKLIVKEKEGNSSEPETPSTPTTPETPKEKSTNAYLSTLGITPKEYDFSGFKKDTMNYSVTIPYDVNSLKVLYKTADSNAKVNVTGNSGFEVGSNNKIIVKVTAEDGKTTKTYTINVTKLAKKEENNDTELKPETPTEQPKEKSTNAYLSTLGITPKEYDFSGFKKTIMDYSVTIPYEVDSLKVLYKTADSNAKVNVTGNSDFEVGSNNKITVKVTAEDGKTTKTYTIKVTKLAEEEDKPGNIIENEEELYLTKLYIDAASLSPKFSKDIYSYTATLNDVNIKELLIEAEANNKDAKIEITGNKELVEGENIVNIILTLDGSKVQPVYQVVVTAHFTPETTQENTNFMGDIMGSINKYVIIAVGIVLLMIITVIVLVILLVKENKRLKEEKNNEEYDVYKNDETEFENIKEETEENVLNETETKNERKGSRREKGRHSK